MTTPIVTEIPRALEPVVHDTFIDGPEAPALPARQRPLYAASRLVARASSERASGRGESTMLRTLAA